MRHLSRQLSRDSNSSTTGPLHSIEEEDKRKSVIQQLGEKPASDKLRIYIRRPSELTPEDEEVISPSKAVSSSYRKPASPQSISNSSNSVLYDSRISDRHSNLEVDSDNIETPPVVRKSITSPIARRLQPPRPLHPETIINNLKKDSSETRTVDNTELENQTEDLSGGTFDRFSAARRTRRYKRPTDYSSGNEEVSPTSNETSFESDTTNCVQNEKPKEVPREENKEDRLKRWQERLQNMHKYHEEPKATTGRTAAKLEKVGRHISSINQEDVREAIRNLKSPTETPERIWSPPRDIIKEKPIKGSNHELNDEGFEETQSLVSDTPSHGKESTSSCNDNVDAITKRTKPIRMTSSDSAGTASSEASKVRTTTSRPQLQNLLERNRRSVERSRSMRSSVEPKNPTPQTVIPRRTNSFRKSEAQSHASSPARRDVERSSSRTSLRSSRSSLNSSVSASTVRKVALKPYITSSTESSPSKRPLATQNSPIARSSNRVPASRSSSSGSSIGPSVRKPPMKSSSLGSTSFKENQSNSKNSGRSSALSSSRSNVSSPGSGGSANQPNSRLNKLVANTSRISGFMRPTASSATKRQPQDNRSGHK